jgi:gliding motility associated protien GldN
MLGSSAAIAQKGSTADEPVSGSGVRPVTDKWRPTLKDGTDDSYIRVKHIGFPIPWQSIREADVLWKKRVWREIDTREKQNIAFRYEGDESTGGGMFIEILVDAVKRGLITAYSAMDADGDRFHTALSKEQFIEKITPKPDTIEAEELDGTIVKKIVQRDFEPAKVTVYRVKEDWIFDRNQGKMVVRIVGIAPIMDYYDENNQFKGSSPLFWLSYPESRTLFSSYEVFNPNNDISRPTWDEFFENRHFSSRITKVTNALNQRYEDVFGTDARGKMEALYESQQQVNDIFNKEHDMWIY